MGKGGRRGGGRRGGSRRSGGASRGRAGRRTGGVGRRGGIGGRRGGFGSRRVGFGSRGRRHGFYGSGIGRRRIGRGRSSRPVVVEHLTHMSRRALTAANQALILKQSKFPCPMKIVLQHSVLYPGNTVTGFLQLDPAMAMPVSHLQIKVVGKEQAYLSGALTTIIHFKRILVVHGHAGLNCLKALNSDGQDQEEYADADAVAAAEAVAAGGTGQDITMRLLGLPGDAAGAGGAAGQAPQVQVIMVQPGQYVYPFSFQLPSTLPATLSSNQGTKTVEVVYMAKAKLVVQGDTVPQETVTYFDVIRPLPGPEYRNSPPSTHSLPPNNPVTACCCISKGTMTASVTCKSMIAIDRDSQVPVMATVDLTNCKANVSEYHISLVHQFFITTPGYVQTENQLLYKLEVAGEQVGGPKQVLAAGRRHDLNLTLALNKTLPPSQLAVVVGSRYYVRLSGTFDAFNAGEFQVETPVYVGLLVDDNNILSQTPPMSNDGTTALSHLDPVDTNPVPPPAGFKWRPLDVRVTHVTVTDERVRNIYGCGPMSPQYLYGYSDPHDPNVACKPFSGDARAFSAAGTAMDPFQQILAGGGMTGGGSGGAPNNVAFFPDISWGVTFDDIAKQEAGLDDPEGQAAFNEALAAVQIQPIGAPTPAPVAVQPMPAQQAHAISHATAGLY